MIFGPNNGGDGEIYAHGSTFTMPDHFSKRLWIFGQTNFYIWMVLRIVRDWLTWRSHRGCCWWREKKINQHQNNNNEEFDNAWWWCFMAHTERNRPTNITMYNGQIYMTFYMVNYCTQMIMYHQSENNFPFFFLSFLAVIVRVPVCIRWECMDAHTI